MYVERALEIDPDQSLAIGVRALNTLFIEERQLQSAVDELVDAIRRRPNSVEALIYLSLFLGTLGHAELANEVSQRSVDLDPLEPHLLGQRFALQFGVGLVAEARRTLEHAKSLGLDRPDWSAYLAVVDGDFDLAKRLYGAEATVAQAMIAHCRGELNDAVRLLDPVKRAVESSTEYQSFGIKHRIAVIEGDADLAVEYYKRGIEAGEPWPLMPDLHGLANVSWCRVFEDMYSHPGFREVSARFGLDKESLSGITVPELPLLHPAMSH
jgi:predicted Zn-dependent protease